MIQMYMHPRQNMALKVMLDMREFSGEVRNMMVVHKGDRPDHFLILIPLLPDQIVTDEIPERLRTRRIFPSAYDLIEFIEQAAIE